MAKAKKAVGRKPLYDKWLTPKGLKQIEEWSINGIYQQDIAKNCGVNVSTFYEWMSKFNELREAVKKGREQADDVVENALYKRAVGYSYIETKTKTIDGKVVETIKTNKEVAGEVTAQIYWLKQRRPKLWNVNTEYIPKTEETTDDNYKEEVLKAFNKDKGDDEDIEE